MAQLGAAIARYHKLIEQDAYRDPAWADELQERMRQQHLIESGRLLAPILRPHFISRRQLDTLARVSKQIFDVLDRIEALALASPPLLNRLQMLPAEKMLAAIPSGYSRFGVTSSLNAHLHNGTISLQGLEACKPVGLSYSSTLADLFLDLPLVKKFKRGRYKLSKLGSPKHLLYAVLDAWREFGGKGKPAIAVLDFGQQPGLPPTEAHLLAETLNQERATACIVSPDALEYTNGRLRCGDYIIDIVFRRMLTRELLARWDLSHPLLEAYRARAICVINSFRSEIVQRRALFDLLTDETVTAQFPAADRKLIRSFVPWTRIVAARKTRHGDRDIDLPEYILREREQLVLLPNEDASENRTFVGARMTPPAWDRALRLALRTPYVVQERALSNRETFPFFQYGEFQLKEAEVTVHPHVFNGQMHGASAVLQSSSSGSATHLAVAPVLLLEEH